MDRTLRKKILYDLFVTPLSVIPITVGLSMLMLSPILGPVAGAIGFAGFLVGGGVMATNFFLNYEAVVLSAMQKVEAQQGADFEKQLDELDRKLTLDQDPRDQTALRNLRALYRTFKDEIEAKKDRVVVPASMIGQIEEIFHASVHHLERQHEIWDTARKVEGDLRKKLLIQRETIIVEVEGSVETFAQTLAEIRALSVKTKTGELRKLQDRLNAQLAATKEAESLVNDDADYSEYRRTEA